MNAIQQAEEVGELLSRVRELLAQPVGPHVRPRLVTAAAELLQASLELRADLHAAEEARSTLALARSRT